MPRSRPRTRLAPSPTGALHLGNVRTFLINWTLARQRDWEVVLRVEDLDGPRVKPRAAQEAMELLGWLGLDWDQGPYWQRADLEPYESALARLAAAGAIYPCRCTRAEIQAAALSAPHAEQHELRYPGTCRPTQPRPTRYTTSHQTAWRFRVKPGETTFTDHVAGVHRHDVAATTGDFLVATKAGLPSYQLAVVVDDARQEIDQVVRGDDLLESTHRQRQLIEQLELGGPIDYYHVGLVRGPDGRRLAKRHGDTRVSRYRSLGVSRERLIGLMGHWCGMGSRRELALEEFVAGFDLDTLARGPIEFTPADEHWLLGD
jgi:glutamyl-tRNA synthetase